MPIKISASELEISNFTCSDPAIVAEFNSATEAGRDAHEVLFTLLSLGAQVAALGSNTASAEKLEATILQAKDTVREATDSVEQFIKKQLNELASPSGILLQSLNTLIHDHEIKIDEITAGEDSPLRVAMLKSLKEAEKRIEDDIASQVAKQKTEIATLLDPGNPTSPLRSLAERMDGLSSAIAKVQEDITKDIAIAPVIEIGVFGGLDYEEEAISWVQRIASANGDDCEPTGNITGLVPRSKKGDGVVDLKVGGNTRSRIVLEAKNQALTKLDWERERDGCRTNRAATSFIGLCKHLNDMPNGNRVLILDTQSIVLAFDPQIDDPELLILIYRMTKLHALSGSGIIDEVNIVEVNRNLEDAVKALSKFDLISKNASAIRNSADTITKEANEIRNSISDKLGAAQGAMNVGITLATLGQPDDLDSSHALGTGE